ncbi:hypothetical protein PG993_008702 [Apiospora rasikravindrae]|uniref:Uncharacterized protein n=1 Tax=Apiospora rasikravindrae TaxID=990691 RepID=A0ABR1SP32_9PEZI
MQITAVAALLSLAATGLAAPTATAAEGFSTLGLRADEVSVPETSQGAGVAPEMPDFDDEEEQDYEEEEDEEGLLSGTTPAVEKRKFNGGWCGIHMKIVNGDYHQADVTVKDSKGNTIRSRHKQVAKGKNLNFKFNKGLPGKDPLLVQIGGITDGLARVQYKGEDFSTGGYNSKNAHCSVGKADQPWVYKDRFVTNLDCGFSC